MSKKQGSDNPTAKMVAKVAGARVADLLEQYYSEIREVAESNAKRTGKSPSASPKFTVTFNPCAQSPRVVVKITSAGSPIKDEAEDTADPNQLKMFDEAEGEE